ncbi:MAG: hypothetical protein ACI8PB_000034 [Desulforhopalus sp.]|jgi:hypothetical protein
MKRTLLNGFCLSLLIIFASACSPTYKVSLKPVLLPQQKYQWEGDLNGVESTKKFYSIKLASSQIEPHFLHAKVVNLDNEHLHISTENFRAYCEERNLYVFSAEESLDQYKKQTELDFRGLNPSDATAIASLAIQSGYVEKRNAEINGFSSRLFRRQSLPPQYQYFGIFQIEYPRCEKKLIVEVLLPKESHVFEFKVNKFN